MNIFINEAMLEKYNLSLAEALILITSEIAEKNNTTLDYILKVIKLKNYIQSTGILNLYCLKKLKELSKRNPLIKIKKLILKHIKILK